MLRQEDYCMTHFYAIFTDNKFEGANRTLEVTSEKEERFVFGEIEFIPRRKIVHTDIDDIFALKESQNVLSEEKKRFFELDVYEWRSGYIIDLFLLAREHLKRNGEIFLIKCLYDGITDELFRSLDKMEIIDLDVDASIRILEPFGKCHIPRLCDFEYYTIYKFTDDRTDARSSLPLVLPQNVSDCSIETIDRLRDIWKRKALRKRP